MSAGAQGISSLKARYVFTDCDTVSHRVRSHRLQLRAGKMEWVQREKPFLGELPQKQVKQTNKKPTIRIDEGHTLTEGFER